MAKLIRYSFPKFSKIDKMWIMDVYDDDIVVNFKKFKDFNSAYEFYKKINSKL